MELKPLKIGLAVVASMLIIGHLFIIDYNDLSWSGNNGTYLGILSNLCLIGAAFVHKKENKNS